MWKGREQTSISGKQKINDLKYNNISIPQNPYQGGGVGVGGQWSMPCIVLFHL